MSRFVSGGTNDEPTERDEEWLQAQQEIEARRREKAEISKQNDGKSLYEVLQANKAAKQEQFEESIRLKNQFRSLDQDEVEFLDSVLESSRAKEAEVKKETREQLEAFRRQQVEAERSIRESGPTESSESTGTQWTVGPRKRKKTRDDILGGVKLRKTSSTEKPPVGPPSPAALSPALKPSNGKIEQAASPKSMESAACQPPIDGKPSSDRPAVSAASPTVGLGLVAYSSDDDED